MQDTRVAQYDYRQMRAQFAMVEFPERIDFWDDAGYCIDRPDDAPIGSTIRIDCDPDQCGTDWFPYAPTFYIEIYGAGL